MLFTIYDRDFQKIGVADLTPQKLCDLRKAGFKLYKVNKAAIRTSAERQAYGYKYIMEYDGDFYKAFHELNSIRLAVVGCETKESCENQILSKIRLFYKLE